MAHPPNPHYASKHPSTARAKPKLAAAIEHRRSAEGLTCEAAFRLAAELGVTAEEIGRTADLTEVRLIRCQLGLFGWPETPTEQTTPPEPMRTAIAAAIEDELVDGGLPCARAWAIADTHGLPRMAVAAVCNERDIRITHCQLGAFA
jgi:hypothetical protein